jgi:hypothetical protein
MIGQPVMLYILYSGGGRFESRLGHWQSRSRGCLVSFLVPPDKFELLPHPFQIISDSSIMASSDAT